MKNNTFASLLTDGLLALGIWAYNTIDPDTSFDPVSPGTLRLTFDNVAGNQDLQLNTDTYRNASGESFTPTTFNYFVSNIKLTRADGGEYVVPQDNSYFLIKENVPASQLITLRNVPAGTYKSVSFLIRVDSLRSTMDIGQRMGVLNPGRGATTPVPCTGRGIRGTFSLNSRAPRPVPRRMPPAKIRSVTTSALSEAATPARSTT